MNAQDFPALTEERLLETVTRWREPHRGWHGVTHLENLLREIATEAGLSMSDREMLRYVALFHDAVYAPLSATNEEDSAELARQSLGSYPRKAEVIQAILATKSHHSEVDLEKKFNAWDCAILHESSWSKLQAYEKGIAFEYAEVERETYRRERSRFLRGAAVDCENPLLQRLADEVASG